MSEVNNLSAEGPPQTFRDSSGLADSNAAVVKTPGSSGGPEAEAAMPQSDVAETTGLAPPAPGGEPSGSHGQEGAHAPQPPPPALNMLADSPLTNDYGDQLGFVAYANALAGLLDHPGTDTPLTIAVSAPWGAGKTSLANMVANRLVERPLQRGERPHIVCWFNAWLQDDAPHHGAAFAAEVARTANRNRTWLRRFTSPLASAMLSPEQRWRRRILIGLGSLAVAVMFALVPAVQAAVKPDATAANVTAAVLGQGWRSFVLFVLVAVTIWRTVFISTQAAARFVDDPKSEAAGGSMQQVHDQLGELIRQAVRNPGRFGNWVKRVWPVAAKFAPHLRGRRRLVLIVDDLERCRPPRGVEVCEAASQLLGHPDVMTILVADMSTVAASAEIKYFQLEIVPSESKEATTSPVLAKSAYGRAYLQKMVQLQFDVPPASSASVRHILTNPSINKLTNPHVQVPSHSGFGKYTRPEAAASTQKTDKVIKLSKIASWAGAFFALFIVFAGILGALAPQTNSSKNSNGPVWAVLLTTLFFLAFVFTAAAVPVILYRRRRRTQRIDEEIKSRAADTEDVESLKASVLESEAGLQGGAALASQRFERFVADDSVLRQQAESEVLRFLPGLPRSAKRLDNHLRLLLIVASERKMLGGVPPLEARHLGKWAVLLERWPELGSAIRANAALLDDIESTARRKPNELEALVRTSLPEVADMSDVTEFFKSDPALAPVASRLIHCRPAAVTSDELTSVLPPMPSR